MSRLDGIEGSDFHVSIDVISLNLIVDVLLKRVPTELYIFLRYFFFRALGTTRLMLIVICDIQGDKVLSTNFMLLDVN